MFIWNKICGFIAFFFTISLSVSSQTLYSTTFYANKEIKKVLFADSVFTVKKVNFQRIGETYSIIPQNYYAQNLGVICKKELALEKVTKVPFRFRLGSLQQCNYLEGKKY